MHEANDGFVFLDKTRVCHKGSRCFVRLVERQRECRDPAPAWRVSPGMRQCGTTHKRCLSMKEASPLIAIVV